MNAVGDGRKMQQYKARHPQCGAEWLAEYEFYPPPEEVCHGCGERLPVVRTERTILVAIPESPSSERPS